MSKTRSTDDTGRLESRPGVPALNGAKLELALVVAVCVLAALVTLRLPLQPLQEVALLGLVAGLGAGWIIVRTRRVVRGLATRPERHSDGSQ